MAVISLVTEAMGTTALGLLEYKTSLVLRSTTIALLDATSCCFAGAFLAGAFLLACLVVTEAESAECAVAATVRLLHTRIKLLSRKRIFI